MNVLLAHVVRLGLIIQTTSVVHGDLITGLGELLAVARGDDSLGDTHCDSCVFSEYEI